MSASRTSGVVGVTVDASTLTATVRYVPGEVGSPSELRRVAVSALRRVAQGRVRVLATEHIGGRYIAGTQARTFSATRKG